MHREFMVNCPNSEECGDDMKVVLTYYAAPEPMTRDYPGAPAEMEVEFKCETCGVDEETCSLEALVRVEEMVEEEMFKEMEAAADAAAEAKYDEWRDRELFGEDY
jgi:hypothetical protein